MAAVGGGMTFNEHDRRATTMNGTRIYGQVKWFNAQKGFGFIEPDSGDQDVFVHVSVLQRAGVDTLRDGDRLSFEIEPDPKNPARHRAVNVLAELQRTGGAA